MKHALPHRPDRRPAPGGTASAAPWLALACLLALAGPAAAEEPPLGRHDGLPCAACHVVGAEGRPRAPAALAAGEAALCARCHASFVDRHSGANHPSGVVPSRPLPAAFPLDAGGRMTCVTCHALHGGAVAFLRSTGPRACIPCHAK